MATSPANCSGTHPSRRLESLLRLITFIKATENKFTRIRHRFLPQRPAQRSGIRTTTAYPKAPNYPLSKNWSRSTYFPLLLHWVLTPHCASGLKVKIPLVYLTLCGVRVERKSCTKIWNKVHFHFRCIHITIVTSKGNPIMDHFLSRTI